MIFGDANFAEKDAVFIFIPDDGDRMFLRNFSIIRLAYTASQLRTITTSTAVCGYPAIIYDF
jgi:hypothetical protein